MHDRQQEAAATACPQCAELTARVAELEQEIARLHEVIAGSEVEAWRDNYPSIRYYEVQIDKADYRYSREFLAAQKKQENPNG